MPQQSNRCAFLPALLALVLIHAFADAQIPSICAWPLETSGAGITNVAYPDTNATYWTMPIDTLRWQAVKITGKFPKSRFFSFVSYDYRGAVVQLPATCNTEAGLNSTEAGLNDVCIKPDPGSKNPFIENAADGPQNYTISLTPTSVGNETNFLPLAHGSLPLAWIIYRIYVPNSETDINGQTDRKAGVELPTISLLPRGGGTEYREVPVCKSKGNSENRGDFASALEPDRLGINLASLEQLAASVDSSSSSCQPVPLVSWVPRNTGGYFPNPANKYIAIPGLCYEKDRIVVVRGKIAVFPSTHDNTPIWDPPGVQMRYWSMCNNNQRAPFPVVDCRADYQTKTDADPKTDDSGYYTYVLSPSEDRNDKTTPPWWIPETATWLPWGSLRERNILLFRNMLPDSHFGHSVQDVIASDQNLPPDEQKCTVDNSFGTTPDRTAIVDAGTCAHNIMQEYYPQAVYCNKQTFIYGGWKACFTAAGVSTAARGQNER